MIFFIADTHFGHSNIIKYCNRPFVSIQKMDNALINNWNSKVKPKDLVYHLGDFSFGTNTGNIRKSLNGDIILIKGSHDKDAMKIYNAFKAVYDLKTISINKQDITLCHYAMRVWNKSHYNSWHLYGHSHGMLPPQGKSWDVGVDNNKFFPLSIDEIADIMKNRPDNFNLVKEKAPEYPNLVKDRPFNIRFL
jgi:calcineurin-like phosphoesterase family protein